MHWRTVDDPPLPTASQQSNYVVVFDANSCDVGMGFYSWGSLRGTDIRAPDRGWYVVWPGSNDDPPVCRVTHWAPTPPDAVEVASDWHRRLAGISKPY